MEERREGQGRDGKKRKDGLNEVYQLKSVITFILYLQTTNIRLNKYKTAFQRKSFVMLNYATMLPTASCPQ